MCFAGMDIRSQSFKIDPNANLPVYRQCELLGISRSSYYYKPKEPSYEKEALKETIMSAIDEIHTRFPYMGARRISVKLLTDYGIKAGRKMVRSLMSEMAIYPIFPGPNLSKRNFNEGIKPYLLRNMNVFLPNQVWSIDITYIKLKHGHMYLTAIIDWYSRCIMGWDLSDSLNVDSVINAVQVAINSHGVPGIINSDQGSQFTSNTYKEMLKSLNIRQSMDGKSRWADNIMIERWFRSLKTEKLYINEFNTPKELRIAIREYIDEYNTERPHEALEYRTPKEVYYSKFNAA